MNEFLEDLLNRRGPGVIGHTGITFGVEIHGGRAVPVTNEEPDPRTFRGEYYYHAGRNVLYKKIIVQRRPEIGLIVAHWKAVSNPPVGED